MAKKPPKRTPEEIAKIVETVSKQRIDWWSYVDKKHSKEGAAAHSRRRKIFDNYYTAFQKYVGRALKAGAAKPQSFLTWFNQQSAESESGVFGGGIVGKTLNKIASNPALSFAAIAALPIAGAALASSGIGGSVLSQSQVGNFTYIGGAALHANLATTPEGRQAIAMELAAGIALAAPFAAPVIGSVAVGAGQKVAGALAAQLSAPGSQAAATPMPSPSSSSSIPVIAIAIGAATLLLVILLR